MNRIDFHTPADARTVIFTYWNERYDEIAKVAMPNWLDYAKRHNYFLRAYAPDGYHLDPSRPETYGDKAKFTYYVDLRGHFDTVMFLDIDTLFMNKSFPIEYVHTPPFTWCYDNNGPLSGIWIADTTADVESDLRYAYEHAAIENNVRHGVIEPNGISDQDMMTRLMRVPPFSRTFGQCLSQTSLGLCYESNYERGQWLITFPGMSPEDKLDKMREWATRSE